MNMFTEGQVELMRNVLFGPRIPLITETSIEGFQLEKPEFMITPNPADKYIDLTPIGNTTIHQVRIIDLQGRIVLNEKINSPVGTKIHLDLAHVASGIYLVQAIHKSSIFTEKVIIE